MKKIVLTIALALSGSLVATVANSHQDEFGPGPVVKGTSHALSGSKETSRLPIRSKHSKKVLNNKFGLPLKRKVHHRDFHQYVKGVGTVLKRKTNHGEIQAKDGCTIPLKRKVHKPDAVKDDVNMPLKRIKHRRAYSS